MSNEYFEMVKPTYIENWPPGLWNHSVATTLSALTDAEVDALIANNIMQLEDGNMPTTEQVVALRGLEAKIDALIHQFPKGAFVRLGSRSPKDDYDASKQGYRYESGAQAIRALCGSERIHDDLWLAKTNDYTPYLAVREWIKIAPWQEFRGFIRGRKLVGLSQYNYLHGDVFPEIVENAGRIEWAIQKKMDLVAGFLPTDDVVVDFIYKMRQYGNEIVNEVIVLEINPFSPYTDPCLFNWHHDNFIKFEFRYCKN